MARICYHRSYRRIMIGSGLIQCVNEAVESLGGLPPLEARALMPTQGRETLYCVSDCIRGSSERDRPSHRAVDSVNCCARWLLLPRPSASLPPSPPPTDPLTTHHLPLMCRHSYALRTPRRRARPARRTARRSATSGGTATCACTPPSSLTLPTCSRLFRSKT